MKRSNRLRVVGVSLVCVALAGCTSKGAAGDVGVVSDVKVDYGVSADAITLGAITDLSGPFKSVGLPAMHGVEMWVEQVNAAGGVCNRQIEIDLKDHGYKAENAISLYAGMKSSALGLVQLVGSPILAALTTSLTTDQVVAALPSVASNNLQTPSALPLSTTYDIEMINALAYLQEEGYIQDGDTIGHLYINNEAGENALAGAKFYAAKHGMDVVAEPISATDTDMTAMVTKFKSGGVSAVLLLGSGAALASTGLQMKVQGLDVPLVGGGPTYSASLLQNAEVVEALQDNYFVSQSTTAFSADHPTAIEIRQEYESKGFTDEPTNWVFIGFLAGLTWQTILEKACESGDLTREGVMKAKGTVNEVDTKGLAGTLDLTVPGAPTTREVFIQQIDPNAIGGLKNVTESFASAEAIAYRAPFQD